MQPETSGNSNGDGRISPPVRVLIVDDEALIRWALSDCFSRAAYDVCEAGDGASALVHFRPGAPPIDLVLLDVNLPDANGVELLKQIKRVCSSCRVLLMTAFGTADTLQDARRNGAYDVLSKPFDVDDMLQTARRALLCGATTTIQGAL